MSTFATVLNCMDGRVQVSANGYIKNKYKVVKQFLDDEKKVIGYSAGIGVMVGLIIGFLIGNKRK